MRTLNKIIVGITSTLLTMPLYATEKSVAEQQKELSKATPSNKIKAKPKIKTEATSGTKQKNKPSPKNVVVSEFFPQWYLGGTVGMSKLNPDVKTDGANLDDKNDLGLGFYLGYDFTENIAVEGYYFDLGEVGVKPGGEIEYEVFGVSALYYFYNTKKAKGLQTRDGLSLFGRAGLGNLNVSSSGNVSTKLDHEFHLHWGGGLEYALIKNTSLRADVEFYDKDARFVSMSILWRFGGNRTQYLLNKYGLDQSNIGTGTSTPNPIVVKPIFGNSIFIDSDKDGVRDEEDACPKTPIGSQVDAVGCFFGGALHGVKFELDSAKLLSQSKILLDGVAQELQKYPRIVIEIQAHTDSTGSEQYNLDLSYRRAKSVRDYLVSQGVSARRMVPRGYGEKVPTSSNITEVGRQKNRRVIFKILAK